MVFGSIEVQNKFNEKIALIIREKSGFLGVLERRKEYDCRVKAVKSFEIRPECKKDNRSRHDVIFVGDTEGLRVVMITKIYAIILKIKNYSTFFLLRVHRSVTTEIRFFECKYEYLENRNEHFLSFKANSTVKTSALKLTGKNQFHFAKRLLRKQRFRGSRLYSMRFYKA